jgi:dUTP pyrophosphatase
MNCKIAKIRPNTRLPEQAHSGEDAGWDIWTAEKTLIPPNDWTYIPTGLILAPESRWWYEVVARSSSDNFGIEVRRSIMDNGFRGELTICVRSMTPMSIVIESGVRLAQIIFHQIPIVIWDSIKFNELPTSQREGRGFGSSGAE